MTGSRKPQPYDVAIWDLVPATWGRGGQKPARLVKWHQCLDHGHQAVGVMRVHTGHGYAGTLRERRVCRKPRCGYAWMVKEVGWSWPTGLPRLDCKAAGGSEPCHPVPEVTSINSALAAWAGRCSGHEVVGTGIDRSRMYRGDAWEFAQEHNRLPAIYVTLLDADGRAADPTPPARWSTDDFRQADGPVDEQDLDEDDLDEDDEPVGGAA